MAILTAADFPAVRAAIDTTIDAAALPDATIALPIFQGVAESQVAARDPLAATRVGADGQHIKNAAVFLTAALLAVALPRLLLEQFGSGYRYQRTPVDPQAQAAALRALADDELDAVLYPGADTSERPTMFVAASGRRGW